MQRISLAHLAGFLISLSLALPLLADFKPPADGKLNEKQLMTYIDIKREQMDALKAAGNASDGSKSTSAGLAIYLHMSEKVQAAVTKHGMTQEEFGWIDENVAKVWNIALWQKRWDDIDKPELDNQIKAKQQELDAAKARLSQYEAAQKSGTRILTKEQRDTAVQQSTADRDAAGNDVKDAMNNVKQIKDEIALHEKEAADAEALASKPPADVSEDDKNNYIDGKKNEAQTAHDAAKEARERLKEAQKAVDDTNAKLAAANGKVDHPDTPVTDDEKAQLKQENDQAIADARETISKDESAIATLKETIAAGPPMVALTQQGEKEKPDPDNVALMKKHIKEYLDATGMSAMLTSK